MYYVYILKCADGKFYIGFTTNLKNRILQHKAGINKATKYKLPVKLLFFCCFTTEKLAICFEKYLKSNSGRAFRNKRLVNYTSLPGEAQRSPGGNSSVG